MLSLMNLGYFYQLFPSHFLMFKRYLICTDLVDGLQRLVQFVPQLAQGGCEQVTFIHCVPPWDEGDVPRIDAAKVREAKEILSGAIAQQTDAIAVDVEVVTGKPSKMLTKTVISHQSDVVIMGTATRNQLQETLFGSTTLSVARATQVPLMLLRPQLICTYTAEELALRCQHLWRSLLVPYNGSESGKYLLEQLKLTLQRGGADVPERCVLITVVNEGGRPRRTGVIDSWRYEQAEAALVEAQAELSACGVEVSYEIRTGDTLPEITQAAMAQNTSAIAIAYVTKQALLELTAPSFANEVLRHSWFPILLFSPRR
jgi:nucleotide-binding universal stress UspA family protein